MSSNREIEQLEADAVYCRERISLLRAKLYRWGLGRNARLQRLERDLELAEQRVQTARRAVKP